MNFSYSEDQAMFRDSVNRFGQENWPSTKRETLLQDGLSPQSKAWEQIAGLGWTLVAIPEENGGLGGSAIDVMALAEGFGKHLITMPFVTNCILVPSLLAGQQGGETLLEAIAAGTVTAAAGLDEEDGGGSPAFIETTARESGGTWSLSGIKAHVEDGGHADWFVIAARVSGDVDQPEGIGLFIVERGADGVNVQTFRAIDGHLHARVTLTDAPAQPVGDLSSALPCIERAIDLAICGHLAEAIGSIAAANDATLDYLKTRKQFGAVIGSFQAIQHRMVDMVVAQEEAVAMCWNAAHACASNDIDRKIAVSAAKVRIGQHGLYVGRQVIQLHGGIGFCEEHIVSHHLRRQMLLDMAHGGRAYHLGRVTSLTV